MSELTPAPSPTAAAASSLSQLLKQLHTLTDSIRAEFLCSDDYGFADDYERLRMRKALYKAFVSIRHGEAILETLHDE